MVDDFSFETGAVLSGGDRSYRGRRRFGAAGGWGLNPSRQMDMSPAEFYSHFRFAKEDIPRLCRALRFPAQFRTSSRCVCEGEEALLVYLKRMSYPNRWVDLDFLLIKKSPTSSRPGSSTSTPSSSRTATRAYTATRPRATSTSRRRTSRTTSATRNWRE